MGVALGAFDIGPLVAIDVELVKSARAALNLGLEGVFPVTEGVLAQPFATAAFSIVIEICSRDLGLMSPRSGR